MSQELAFAVTTPLGFTLRCTRSYWDFIVEQKHPALRDREREIEDVLADPDQIRRSRRDPQVLLFYRGASPRWLCAVVRREDGTGFLITAYPTDTMKMGDLEWTRSK